MEEVLALFPLHWAIPVEETGQRMQREQQEGAVYLGTYPIMESVTVPEQQS